ncbi:MAG: N-acetylmuramoyl-L-alanine amidase [Thermodesulfovibrio sp.]|nr:N-acetylmuramoyl-L-alanine amidase [Thermodesulfovibrio sp.]
MNNLQKTVRLRRIKSQKSENRSFYFRRKKMIAGFGLLFFCILLLPSTAVSGDAVELKGIRHWVTSEYVRIAIDISGAVEFTKGRLTNPERLYCDFKNTKLKKGLQTNYPIAEGFVKTVRISQYDANTVRVVFDLRNADYDYKISSLEDPPRLVVDFFPKGTDEKKIDAKSDMFLFKRVVVLDAGHGGHDPGAVGFNKLYEKDVVLNIVLKMRDIMTKEYPLYEVILTRDSDVFIPLDERAAIANKKGAELFVSVHANASPNRQARGIETYLLNWTNDEESMRVAARENAISLKKMKQVQNELGFILASLERESKRDESVKLAGQIQNSLTSTVTLQYPEVNNLGVKQALFYVLVGAKMPSSLVEVSFISNLEEEKLLSDESYRQKIAYSIVAGIHAYFASTTPQKVEHHKDAKSKNGHKVKPIKYTRR